MSIKYCEKERVFTLQTQNATYQMIVDSHGYLLHCYYGAKIERQNLSYCIQPQDRGFAANPPDAAGDRTLSPDTLPQEYSTFGVGDFRESCLAVRDKNGGEAADLRYGSYRIYPGKKPLNGLPAAYGNEKDVDTLEIDLRDKVSGLVVTLRYSVFAQWDVIARSVIAPYELPIELVVGILGSVIFIALLLYRLNHGRKAARLGPAHSGGCAAPLAQRERGGTP